MGCAATVPRFSKGTRAVRRIFPVLVASTLVAILAVLTPETAAVSDVLISTDSARSAAAANARDIPDNGDLGADDVERLGGAPAVPALADTELPEGDFRSLLTEKKITPITAPKQEVAPVRPVESDPQELLKDAAEDLPIVEQDAYSNTYERPNGSRILQESDVPINVESGSGWEEISTELTPVSGGGWEAETHPLAPVFAEEADDPGALTVTGDGHEVGFRLQGAGEGDPEVQSSDKDSPNDTLVYEKVKPNIDLQYVVENAGVKEALVLNVVPTSASWSWFVDADSLTPQEAEGGRVDFLDDEGVVVMHIPAPVAWDSSGWRGSRPMCSSIRRCAWSR